jgi:hypothetical protein
LFENFAGKLFNSSKFSYLNQSQMSEYHDNETVDQNRKHAGIKPFFIFVGAFAVVLILIKVLMNLLG